jgi:hypothetical protein
MKLFKVLLMVGVALIPTGASAQSKMELGVKGGLNYSNLNLNSGGRLASVNYNPSVGFHLGGYALFKFAKLGVQPEVIFSRQGQYFSTPYNTNLQTPLNYINIPVIIKYYLVGSLNVQAGPQLGILMGSKGDLIQIQNGFIVGQPVHNQNLNNYLKGTDFSFAFGAGIDLPANLNFSVRYNIGLSDINKNTGDATFTGGLQPSFSTAYTRNQFLQVSIGYQLRKLGK